MGSGSSKAKQRHEADAKLKEEIDITTRETLKELLKLVVSAYALFGARAAAKKAEQKKQEAEEEKGREDDKGENDEYSVPVSSVQSLQCPPLPARPILQSDLTISYKRPTRRPSALHVVLFNEADNYTLECYEKKNYVGMKSKQKDEISLCGFKVETKDHFIVLKPVFDDGRLHTYWLSRPVFFRKLPPLGASRPNSGAAPGTATMPTRLRYGWEELKQWKQALQYACDMAAPLWRDENEGLGEALPCAMERSRHLRGKKKHMKLLPSIQASLAQFIEEDYMLKKSIQTLENPELSTRIRRGCADVAEQVWSRLNQVLTSEDALVNAVGRASAEFLQQRKLKFEDPQHGYKQRFFSSPTVQGVWREHQIRFARCHSMIASLVNTLLVLTREMAMADMKNAVKQHVRQGTRVPVQDDSVIAAEDTFEEQALTHLYNQACLPHDYHQKLADFLQATDSTLSDIPALLAFLYSSEAQGESKAVGSENIQELADPWNAGADSELEEWFPKEHARLRMLSLSREYYRCILFYFAREREVRPEEELHDIERDLAAVTEKEEPQRSRSCTNSLMTDMFAPHFRYELIQRRNEPDMEGLLPESDDSDIDEWYLNDALRVFMEEQLSREPQQHHQEQRAGVALASDTVEVFGMAPSTSSKGTPDDNFGALSVAVPKSLDTSFQ